MLEERVSFAEMARRSALTAALVAQQLLEDSASESDLDSQHSVGDDVEDNVISDPNTEESDDDLVSNFVEELHRQNLQFTARDGQVWMKTPTAPNVGRRPAYNIVREVQGPTRSVLQNCCRSPSDAFKVFLTTSVVSTIVECANREGA